MSKKLISLFLLFIFTLSLCACQSFVSAPVEGTQSYIDPVSDALTVHFLDVGQGDSILLQSNNAYVLIDASEKEYATTVCEYIENLGTNTIDYVIATHPHSDHCGGLSEVLYQFDCKNFIAAETDQQTKTWIDVLLAVEDTGTNYIDATVSSSYTFGNATFEIMGPCSSIYDDYNDYSVIVKATCGNTSFLFTGDAEALAEKEMVSNGADLKADVLKVSHHGSRYSSCNEFLDAVDPEYAVISCGIDNDYGHPHKEVLDRLNNRNIKIYRTDKNGTIVAHSDNNNITFELEKADKSNTPDKESTETTYIGNKNSKKFHLPDCDSTKKMSTKNKVYFNSRQKAVDSGYSACKSCQP